MDLISLTTAGGLSMDTLESHSSETCESVICLCGVLPSRREVEEHHAHSITEIFDAISYKKGSTVIRMLQGYLGADMFQKRARTGCERKTKGNRHEVLK
ncbi:aminopeptidase 1-like isoform X2 [Castanea sativa]|uniref:aminopeptidase 1-like isoform X2 n=1 Tax=Castanea sativa TaxID=21020 RepID=UPI003F651DA9